MSTLFRLLLVVAGAFIAWGLWLGEICWIKGWAGLAWLSGFNWSAVPICLLIVAVASYVVAERVASRRRLAFIAVGFLLTMAAFVAARAAAFDLFSFRFFDRQSVNWWAIEDLLFIALAGMAVCVGLVVAANRFLAPVRRWTVLLLAVALLLAVPLSLVTIAIFPALNGSDDAIHAVKMRYPVFWTALLVPLALRLGRRARQ
jgi:hypothetical protein